MNDNSASDDANQKGSDNQTLDPEPAPEPDVGLQTVALTGRNRLFARLAVINGFTNEGEIQSSAERLSSCEEPIENRLVEAGAITPAACDAVHKLVEAHLSVHNNDPEQSLSTLDELTKSFSAPGNQSKSGSASLPKYGVSERDRFGEYELIEEIARGGMGVVFKARQRKMNRIVALKMIRSGEFADSHQVVRFIAEAEAAGKLDHAGIVPIYEVGEIDGLQFYSMAFIEGRSLNDIVKSDGPLPAKEAARIVRLAAEALQAAHDKGVIHRDIKPHNILLDQNNPRITDFGLAKQVSGDAELTTTGQILGTPSYMPPEQATGSSRLVGNQADVYSLCATLYFLLTGRPPFQAANTTEIIRQVTDMEPVLPRRLNPDVPRDLETICLKGMRKEINKRYASAKDLSNDLQRWLDNKPILARRVTAFERIWLWSKRHPALLGTAAAALAAMVVLAWIGIASKNSAESSRLVDGLLKADTAKVGSIIGQIKGYEGWARPDLLAAYENFADDSNAKLHAALALLPEKRVAKFLGDRLLTVPPAQFEPVRELLKGHHKELIDRYWGIAENSQTNANRRFHAACALASFDKDDARWRKPPFARFVADQLVDALPSQLILWRNALRPARKHLLAPLADIYRDKAEKSQRRTFAADSLADYLADDPKGLFQVTANAESVHFPLLFNKLKTHAKTTEQLACEQLTQPVAAGIGEEAKDNLAVRKANAAVMLAKLGKPDALWPLLRFSPDPRVRSFLIHRLGPLKVDASLFVARFHVEPDKTVRRALLFCLGECDTSRLPAADRESLIKKLLKMYRSEPDAGLRSASEWLLRQWSHGESIAVIDADLKKKDAELHSNDNQQGWYVNSLGQTFIVLDARDFQMGSPKWEAPDREDENLHTRHIGRRFAIAANEVTRAEFFAFDKKFYYPKREPDPQKTKNRPQTGINWYTAAHYCNWLSEQEGIPENQWCYQPNDKGKFGPMMKIKKDYLTLTGYRLPTEAEFEFACRAGTITRRYYGNADSLLKHYAWYQANGQDKPHPVGSLKPNDFGLFDTLGNVAEWCHERHKPYPIQSKPITDAIDFDPVNDRERRILRGSGFINPADRQRAAIRDDPLPSNKYYIFGVRPARTLK